MTDSGFMQGWELWWARAMAEKSGSERKQEDILGEVSDRFGYERSAAYDNLKKVDALLAPQLKECDGDLFVLIGRILSSIEMPTAKGETVAEVDLDSDEVTHLEGWEDALNASLRNCEFSKHPARYLRTIIDAMTLNRSRLDSARQLLTSRIELLDKELNKFRGRGRPKRNTGSPRQA